MPRRGRRRSSLISISDVEETPVYFRIFIREGASIDLEDPTLRRSLYYETFRRNLYRDYKLNGYITLYERGT